MSYKIKFSDITIGDQVNLRGGFGKDPSCLGLVTNLEENGKNGQDIVDYVTEQGVTHWAYMHQVDSIAQKAVTL